MGSPNSHFSCTIGLHADCDILTGNAPLGNTNLLGVTCSGEISFQTIAWHGFPAWAAAFPPHASKQRPNLHVDRLGLGVFGVPLYVMSMWGVVHGWPNRAAQSSRLGCDISCWAALDENEEAEFVRAEWGSSLMVFVKAYFCRLLCSACGPSRTRSFTAGARGGSRHI